MIGGYQIVELLGGGTMGKVYRAVQLSMNRPVALKVLSLKSAQTEPYAVKRFLQEAKSSARLNHKAIIQVYDIGRAGDIYYIAMELIEGTDLKGVLQKEGYLEPLPSLDYIIPILEALEHAATQNIVHRDIKPANIMVTQEGGVKLADLGLAKILANPFDEHGPGGSLTVQGAIMGTPFYMAPEQARDSKNVDHRADIYAVGAMWYHMLYGNVPHYAESNMDVISRVLHEKPKFPMISPEVAKCIPVLKKLMAKDRDRRYQTATEALADLRKLRDRLEGKDGGRSSGSRSSRLMPRTGGQKKSRTPLVIAGMMIMLGLAAGTLFFLKDRIFGTESTVTETTDDGDDSGGTSSATEETLDLAAMDAGEILIAARKRKGASPKSIYAAINLLSAAKDKAETDQTRRDIQRLRKNWIDLLKVEFGKVYDEAAALAEKAEFESAYDKLTAFHEAHPLEELKPRLKELRGRLDEKLEERLDADRETVDVLAGKGEFDAAREKLSEIRAYLPADRKEKVASWESEVDRQEKQAARARKILILQEKRLKEFVDVFRNVRRGNWEPAEKTVAAMDEEGRFSELELESYAESAELKTLREVYRAAEKGLLAREEPFEFDNRRHEPRLGEVEKTTDGWQLRTRFKVHERIQELSSADILELAEAGGLTLTPYHRAVVPLYQGDRTEARSAIQKLDYLSEEERADLFKRAKRFAEIEKVLRADDLAAESAYFYERGMGYFKKGKPKKAFEWLKFFHDHYQDARTYKENRDRLAAVLDELAPKLGRAWRETPWDDLLEAPIFLQPDGSTMVLYDFTAPEPGRLRADWTPRPFSAKRSWLADDFLPPEIKLLGTVDKETAPWTIVRIDGETGLYAAGWQHQIWKGHLVGDFEVEISGRLLVESNGGAGPTVLIGDHAAGKRRYMLAYCHRYPLLTRNLKRNLPDSLHAPYKSFVRHGRSVILEGNEWLNWRTLVGRRDSLPDAGTRLVLTAGIERETGETRLHLNVSGETPLSIPDAQKVPASTFGIAAYYGAFVIETVKVRGKLDPDWK